MRMVEILPSHVREWVSKLTREGVRPPALQYCMVILSAIFTTALNDQVTFLHPCKGVKTPPVPKKARQIITPEQFDALHKALPEGNIRLLAETDIESGLRWGELTELRVRDLNFGTRILTVSRGRGRNGSALPSRGRALCDQELPEGQRAPPTQGKRSGRAR